MSSGNPFGIFGGPGMGSPSQGTPNPSYGRDLNVINPAGVQGAGLFSPQQAAQQTARFAHGGPGPQPPQPQGGGGKGGGGGESGGGGSSSSKSGGGAGGMMGQAMGMAGSMMGGGKSGQPGGSTQGGNLLNQIQNGKLGGMMGQMQSLFAPGSAAPQNAQNPAASTGGAKPSYNSSQTGGFGYVNPTLAPQQPAAATPDTTAQPPAPQPTPAPTPDPTTTGSIGSPMDGGAFANMDFGGGDIGAFSSLV